MREIFEIRFMSEGGEFERPILAEGFALDTIEPRITQEKIAQIAAVNDQEKLGTIYSRREIIEKVRGDMAFLKAVKPVAVVTGSYVSIPLSCRVLAIPLVWTIQLTWLKAFFASGAGMTDGLPPGIIKSVADFVLFETIRFWMWFGFIRPIPAQLLRVSAHRCRQAAFALAVRRLSYSPPPPYARTLALPSFGNNRFHFRGWLFAYTRRQKWQQCPSRPLRAQSDGINCAKLFLSPTARSTRWNSAGNFRGVSPSSLVASSGTWRKSRPGWRPRRSTPIVRAQSPDVRQRRSRPVRELGRAQAAASKAG